MMRFFIVISLLLACALLHAQENTEPSGRNQYFIQLVYHQGAHWNRTEFLQEQMAAGFKGIEARFGLQTLGKKLWHQYNNYPRIGLGIHNADEIMDKTDTTLGNPLSLYLFFTNSWAKFGRFSLNTNLASGLSYTSLIHHPVTNPYNDVVGSHINLYLEASLFLGIRLSERFDMNVGYGMNHYSNGHIHQPQKGLNNWGWNAGLSYNFGGRDKPFNGGEKPIGRGEEPFRRGERIYREPPEFHVFEELQFMASVGVTEWQLPTMAEGYHYMASSLSADYAYHFAVRSALSLGLDFFYDGSLEQSHKINPEDVRFIGKTQLGAHFGYQLTISRLTLLFNMGTYFKQHTYIRGFYYTRAGGRIRISDQLYAHLCIKSRAGIRSDYIEWGLAYHLKTRE